MDIIKELKQKSIVEFFQVHLNIDLQKTGKNYCCPCPIHEDTSPSFYVDPIKNKCACYGSCNFNGDIIDFIIRYKNLTFPEGVEWLAAKYKLNYKKSHQSNNTNPHDVYYTLCDFIKNHYVKHREKPFTKIGRKYLTERTTQEIISEFDLCIAPTTAEVGTWTFLTDALKQENFNLEIAEKIGVIRKSEKGTYYDLFLGRIIIPIFDVKDRCIGFNTRSYTNSVDTPKYLLSKETPIFKKNQFIFGLNKSSKHIARSRICYIVEGCFDFFRMYSYGFKNTVPLLGGKIFANLPDSDVYTFLMDPDNAGIKYSLENGATLLKNRKTVFISECGKDPDDCSKIEIENILNSSLSYIDFYIKHIYKYKTSIEHKLNVLDKLCVLLNGITKEQLILYTKTISKKLEIPEHLILFRFGLENKINYMEIFEQASKRNNDLC